MPKHELASRSLLRPEQALLEASWIAALALLAFNDHWLKHAGLLPNWLTGKLSDYAGLYVAPALLATLVRARTRGALLACHAAVFAVFAAINLDATWAQWWARSMSRFGFDWRIVTDAEDLIAAPALIASWRWLTPAMSRPARDAGTRVRRVLQRGSFAFGLLCCMATSDDGPYDFHTDGPHLHNPSHETVTVLVRPLRAGIRLDCEAIAKDPGALIPEAAFDVARAYEIGEHENVGLPAHADDDCSAVRLTGNGLPAAIVFWEADDPFAREVPPSYDRTREWQPGVIVLLSKNGQLHEYHDEGGYLYEVESARPERSASCAVADEAQRPAFSTDLPTGMQELIGVDAGPDGCVALRTRHVTVGPPVSPRDADADAGALAGEDAGVEPEPAGAIASAAYVCVPAGMFPFHAGDVVEIGTDQRDVGATRLHIVQRDARGLPATELDVVPLRDSDFVTPLDLQLERRESCAYIVDERCAQTSVAAELQVRVGKDRVTLRGGETEHVSASGFGVDLALPIGQYRALLDTECAAGSPEPGGDAALVAVMRWEGT
jgi:hypothetical protein